MSKNEDGFSKDEIKIKIWKYIMIFGQDLMGKGWELHKVFKINTCAWEMFSKARCIGTVEALKKKVNRPLEA